MQARLRPIVVCVSALADEDVETAQRHTPVLPVFGLGRNEQEFLAVTDRFERIARHTEFAHQRLLERGRAALLQRLVGSKRADSIGMALDQHARVRIAAQDAIKRPGDVFNLSVLRIWNLGRAEGEIDRLDID